MASQYYTPLSNGLQSFADASPEYVFAEAGIGSFQEQASRLAEFGRNGDIYVVHAAEGETVIPTEVLDANPKVRELLYEQMRGMGLDPQEYVVGNELNSLNPVTGMPEFFFKSIFKSVKKAFKKVGKVAKKWAPLVLPIAATMFGVPFLGTSFGVGTFGASFLGSGIGSLIGGASVKDSLKAGLTAGATTAAFSGLSGAFSDTGTFAGGVKGSFTGKTPVFDPGLFDKPTGFQMAASPGADSQYSLNLSGASDPERAAASRAFDKRWGGLSEGDIVETLNPFKTPIKGDPGYVSANIRPGPANTSFTTAKPTQKMELAKPGDISNYLVEEQKIRNLAVPAPALKTPALQIPQAGPPAAITVAPSYDDLRPAEFDADRFFSRNFAPAPPAAPKVVQKPEYTSVFDKFATKLGDLFTRGGDPQSVWDAKGQEAAEAVWANPQLKGISKNSPLYAKAFSTAEAARAAAMDPGALATYGPTVGLGTLAYLAFNEDPEKQELASLEDERQRNRLLIENPRDFVSDNLNPYTFSARKARDLIVPTTYPYQMQANQGGLAQYPRREMLVEGPGTERSDDIPAMLSDGEFVLNARSVRGADPTGQGNRYRGAQNLYSMMRDFEMRA